MDNKKTIISIIILLIVIVGGYFLLNKQPISTEPIKIGFIGPLTGENAAIGEGIKNAISLSAKEKNIEIIYEDDQFNTRLGVTAYNKLRDIDKVDAIINTTPGVIDAITPLLAKDSMIIIQIAEPESSTDDTIFQIMPSGATLYSELGKVAREKYRSFAFIFQQGATFQKAKNAFQEAYQDSDHVFQEYQLDESKDYRTTIAKIKSSDTEAYTIIATPSVGVQFIRQMSEQKANSSLLCNADLEVTISEYLKILPEKIFDDCVSIMFTDRMSGIFKKEYKDTFGIDPGFATDYGYDAVTILSETYNSNINNWVKSMKDLMYQGVSGKIQFDNVGMRVPEIEKHIFKDGKFVSI